MNLLNAKENAAAQAFWERHRAIKKGGQLKLLVTETGLGTVKMCRCGFCGAEENITDFSDW